MQEKKVTGFDIYTFPPPNISIYSSYDCESQNPYDKDSGESVVRQKNWSTCKLAQKTIVELSVRIRLLDVLN